MVRDKRALNGQHLITVSKGIEREISQGKRIVPASIRTIYNPFDFDEIECQSRAEVANIPEGDFFIHVGRFAKQKRHDVLFQALRLTKNKLPIVLLCHNQKKALKVAKKFGVSDRIILPGFQRNPFPWVKHANALVLSSDYEGLPTVLIESLAVGTPVVSTNCPYGPDEILTGDLANFLVPVRDPAALALKLDEVLELKSDNRRAEILSKVKADQIVKSYIDLIDGERC